MKDRRFQSNPSKSKNGDGAGSDQDTLLSAKRERMLQQRVRQLEAIFDNLPDAVIVTDPEGRIVSTNRRALRLLGKTPGSVPADRWPVEFGFFLDDGETYYPGQRMPIARALQGETVTSEEMVLKPEGAAKGIWVSVSARPLLAADGDFDGAVVVFRDISYRKQIELSREKHIQRAEGLYRLSKVIAEVSDDLLQILNTAVLHAAEMIGDACVAYLISDDGAQIAATASYHPNPSSRALLRELMLSRTETAIDESIVGGVVRSGEPLVIPSIAPQQLAAITAPGFARFINTVGMDSIVIVPLKGREGVLGTLGLTRDAGRPAYTSDEQSFLEDIARRTALAVENCKLFDSLRAQVAERRSAERALSESEERFRSIFEGSALGIKLLDPDGVLLQTNPALQRFVGRTDREMVGHHFTEFIHPDDVELSRRHLANMLSDRLDKTYLDHRLMSKDGEVVWVRGTFAAVRDSDADGENDIRFIVVMVENITESMKVNAELLEMKARLLTQVEMERLRLAQELHDGPMQELHSVIYQFGTWHEKLEPENQSLLDEARDMIIQVIQELRSVAKDLRPPTIMDFGLEKAIRSHVEEFKDKHPDLTIHLALTSDRQLLSEDVRLALFRIYQQALMNVVRHADAKNVTVRFTLDADEVALEIQDDGKGFVVPSRWITLTRQGHFGLAGSAERVETLGGDLRVYSEPGKGTRLVARIPIQVGQVEH